MMKHFKTLKKVTLAATAAFLLLFTATRGTGMATTLPAITVEKDESPNIRPLSDADENDETPKYKRK